MGLLIIDEEKCKKDGICVRECPMVIIKQKDEDSFPEIVPGGEDICNSCGHCVAICPHGALSHAWVPIEKSPLIEKDLEIDEARAVQFLRSRRSIRFFKKQPVEREKLQRLIEIARYAPTGGNLQSVEWVVFTDEEKIKAIAEQTVEWMRKLLAKAPQSVPPYFPIIVGAWDMGYNSVTWSAPALILASAPKDAIPKMVDVTLALSYFELAAPKLGLGTCWAGLVNGAMQASAAVREAVGLPDGHAYYYPMMVGYPKMKYARVPERKAPEITWK
ncbi:MAG: nitroreductase family protein [Deltaproteobacteria bacterium]|nr:nitroreductase family protein [Deltaproteobacteria bacterium]MBW1819134.1 nitroreductase family protein [Deltaproteobacteria bacterium]MBW2285149.1 nitroreductase family protein [Deltaproteobacteria bacterium]